MGFSHDDLRALEYADFIDCLRRGSRCITPGWYRVS